MAKSKYNPNIVKQIIKIIEDGNFAKIAYEAVGIGHDTFYSWLKQKPEFSEAIKKAKARRIQTLISEIRQAEAWQSKCWIAERVNRKLFHLPTANERDMAERLTAIETKLDESLKAKETI